MGAWKVRDISHFQVNCLQNIIVLKNYKTLLYTIWKGVYFLYIQLYKTASFLDNNSPNYMQCTLTLFLPYQSITIYNNSRENSKLNYFGWSSISILWAQFSESRLG